MKNWICIIYIGLVGCLVTSCQQSLDEVVQESTIGKAEISFTIALDDIESRATWEDNEGSTSALVGTEKENAFDLTSEDGLKVFVCSTTGIPLGEVTNKQVRKVDTNVYKFNGQLVIENLTTSTFFLTLCMLRSGEPVEGIVTDEDNSNEKIESTALAMEE